MESYSKMTIDDMTATGDTNIKGIGDLDLIKGNYPITAKTLSDATRASDFILGGSSAAKLSSVKGTSAAFNDENRKYETARGPREPNIFPRGTGSLSTFQPDPPGSYIRGRKGTKKGAIFEECIPCGTRSWKGGHQPGKELLGILEQDLVRKYRQLLNQYKALLSNTEVYDDLCSLLNFMEIQCMPDLFGMVSLLQTLALKLTDIKLINPSGAFMSFLTPFFSPILGGLTEILDKYIQLILGPIDCVVKSLDAQLSKLDVNNATSKASSARRSQINTNVSFMERKVASLVERRDYLNQRKKDGTYANNPSSYPAVDRSATNRERKLNGEVAPNKRDETGQIVVDPNNRNGAGAITTQDAPFSFVSREEELDNIKEELDKLRGADGKGGLISEQQEALSKLSKPLPPKSERQDAIGAARNKLNDSRSFIGNSLHDVRKYILDGKSMINDTANVWKLELERTLKGRAATTEDMLQGAADLQKIARILGVINALMSLHAIGKSGNLCNNKKDPSAALGSFLSASNHGNNDANTPAIAIGQDEDGGSILVVVGSDVEAELVEDSPDGSSSKAKKVGDMKQANSAGSVLDIGNISKAQIKATNEFGESASVAVIKFNLCGEISSSTKSNLDTIKKWAGNVGN
jgi:hypothetical protein